MQVSPQIENAIRESIEKDFQPDTKTVYAKVGLAVALGGALSLALCGQFGVAASPIALALNESLHMNYGGLFCAVACGSLFAIVPLSALRFMCTLHQFRMILRQRIHAPMIWIAVFGSLLAYHGDVGNDIAAVAAWFVAAIVIFELLGMVWQNIESRLPVLTP